MNILIADDHALLSQAVANALHQQVGFSVSVTESREGAMRMMEIEQFDVVLLDLKMPGMNGLRSVIEIVNSSGGARVVLFTGDLHPRMLEQAIDAGLAGYVPKSLPLQSLDLAIRLIGSGQIFIPQGAQANLTTAPNGHGSGTELTTRELFVLKMAADGATNKEIAGAAVTSEAQVKMLMRGICNKLNARNRAHACIIARDQMLL